MLSRGFAKRAFCCLVLVFGITSLMLRGSAGAVTVLDFEGLQNLEPVLNFYNGGLGGSGSGPGPNLGVTFSPNGLAIIQSGHGGTGNIGGLPSPFTVLFFLTGASATLNLPAGFTTGFSFFYSAINNPGSIVVHDGLNGTGTVLATLALPVTPASPPGVFSPFFPIGVAFSGTAESIDFGGTENQIAFDNITFGSDTPVGAAPEPATLLLWGTTMAGLGLVRRRRR